MRLRRLAHLFDTDKKILSIWSILKRCQNHTGPKVYLKEGNRCNEYNYEKTGINIFEITCVNATKYKIYIPRYSFSYL